jgi:aspartate/methionine/tyrosine aminotransferase
MVTPGTLFGDTDNRYMRMSLLQPVERMQEAMDRMMAAKERLFVHVR